MFNFEPDLIRQIKVLIVDDDPDVRELFSEILAEEGYLVETAVDGMEALDKLESFKPDLILTDYKMPRMDGITLCKVVKNNPETIDLGVILITGFNDFEVRVHGLSAGADDFLSKPVMLPELKARIKSLAKAKIYHDLLKDYQKRLEKEVEEKTAELKKANLALNLAYRELEDLSLEIVYRLARAAEYRDEHTGNHIQRISLYCVAIGKRLGLNERQLDLLRYGSILHDIGKLGIPDEILLKPGSLTPEEWEIMKKHTIIGQRSLRERELPILKLGKRSPFIIMRDGMGRAIHLG
jgi:putative two-component system response regulator